MSTDVKFSRVSRLCLTLLASLYHRALMEWGGHCKVVLSEVKGGSFLLASCQASSHTALPVSLLCPFLNP